VVPTTAAQTSSSVQLAILELAGIRRRRDAEPATHRVIGRSRVCHEVVRAPTLTLSPGNEQEASARVGGDPAAVRAACRPDVAAGPYFFARGGIDHPGEEAPSRRVHRSTVRTHSYADRGCSPPRHPHTVAVTCEGDQTALPGCQVARCQDVGGSPVYRPDQLLRRFRRQAWVGRPLGQAVYLHVR
jgi:hypothetical protein